MIDDPDARRVRAAAVRVGAWVGIASAVAVVAGVGVLLFVLSRAARPEAPGPRPTPPDGDRLVVDVDEIVPLILLLALLGVLLLAAVGIIAARRSVAPLAEALRTQRTFVADASHELRTPLTALSSRIQILQRRHARGEPLDALLARLRDDVRAMEDVLTDLLVSAEGSSVVEGAADVEGCIGDAIALLEPLASSRGVTLQPSVPAPLTAAIASPTLVRLVVALLDNAIQHSPDGASVDVDARLEGGGAALRVRDSGPGIPADERQRIFERFAHGAESGRRRGFGIGLALVHRAAERAHGSIVIEETSASGTTFLLRLPVAR